MDLDQIVRWYFAERPRLLLDDQAVEAFHLLGPRCRFFKTLPVGATILDAGAGDGGLHNFRTWPYFPRTDLKLYAYGDAHGTNFGCYEGSEIGFWPEHPPEFKGVDFDAIVACNFIEHINGPDAFVRWACQRLRHGRLYLEWPTPASIDLPSATDLRERGIDVMTGNYFDDHTHRAPVPDRAVMQSVISAEGLEIESWGIASVPCIDGELASVSRARRARVEATLAYWSYTGWCQYLVARRPH